jgi:hypothetical protein
MDNQENSITGNCRKTVSGITAGQKWLRRRNCGALFLILLCVCMAIIAPSSPAMAQFNSKQCITPSAMPAPMQDGILVGAIVNDQLNFGQALNFMITVSNIGPETAKNVHLYCRANPGGSFMLDVIDQPYVLRDEDNQDVTLDDLYPGTQQQVNFSIQAPQSQQIPGEWSHNFHFNFSMATNGSAESSVGAITLSTRQGKILVIKSGFAQ